MSEAKTINVSHLRFSSTVFPSDGDMRLWNSLSPIEQRVLVLRDIEEGLSGRPAANAGKEEIMAEVIAELRHAL